MRRRDFQIGLEFWCGCKRWRCTDIGSRVITAISLQPDEDGTDVDLASVGRVETDYEEGVARLCTASAATDVGAVEPEPYLGMILSQLPVDAIGENDLLLLVEVPLIRNEGRDERVSLKDVSGIHIGTSSEEVWLLAKPAEDFAVGSPPT